MIVKDQKDLNVLAIGDSLFGGHNLPAGAQWLELLAKQCEWNLTNLGVNGWTLAHNPDAYADKSQVRTSMYNKLMTDSSFCFGNTSSTYYTYGTVTGKRAADVDVVFLEGGWNDFGWGIPLGTEDDSDGSTYMGAVNGMVQKLLQTYPNAKVVLITSWHRSDVRAKDNANRLDFTANGMKKVYNKHYAQNDRVVLIDAGNPDVSGILMNDSSWRAKYAIDTAHLNAEGMELMAENMLPLIWKYVIDK